MAGLGYESWSMGWRRVSRSSLDNANVGMICRILNIFLCKKTKCGVSTLREIS